MAVCPTMVRPVLDRERRSWPRWRRPCCSTSVSHRQSGYQTVGFSLTSTLLGFHTVVWQIRDVFLIAFIFGTIPERRSWLPCTVVWQIRDVFLFAFIFGTIPKSQLWGLKLPIYSGWTVDPSREACWTVSPAAASLSGTPSATCPRRPWSLSLVNLCQ